MNAITKAVDEKFCSECAAVIKAKAVVCPKCGCPQTAVANQSNEQQQRSKNTAGIMALLLGGLGAHKFYLGQPTQGILYLVFCWTFIPVLLALLDAIRLFGMKPAEFNTLYNQE